MSFWRWEPQGPSKNPQRASPPSPPLTDFVLLCMYFQLPCLPFLPNWVCSQDVLPKLHSWGGRTASEISSLNPLFVADRKTDVGELRAHVSRVTLLGYVWQCSCQIPWAAIPIPRPWPWCEWYPLQISNGPFPQLQPGHLDVSWWPGWHLSLQTQSLEARVHSSCCQTPSSEKSDAFDLSHHWSQEWDQLCQVPTKGWEIPPPHPSTHLAFEEGVGALP